MSGFLIVSIHDVAPPNLGGVEQILKCLEIIGVQKRSLLVIPNFRGCWRVDQHHRFAQWLSERQGEGDEIVLHGYEHVEVHRPQSLRDRVKNRLYTRGEGEFLSLNYEAARNRIDAGIAILKSAGIKTHGFIAPAWLINTPGLAAAKDAGFEYTNSYSRVLDLASGESIFAPSLVFGPGNLNEEVALQVQRLLSRLIMRRPLIRVVIHPPCVENPRRFKGILAIVREQLSHHRAVTYSEFVAGWRNKNGAR